MRRDVQEIFRATPHEKQVMMFSATLSKEIRPVCKKFMQDVGRFKPYLFIEDWGLVIGDQSGKDQIGSLEKVDFEIASLSGFQERSWRRKVEGEERRTWEGVGVR